MDPLKVRLVSRDQYAPLICCELQLAPVVTGALPGLVCGQNVPPRFAKTSGENSGHVLVKVQLDPLDCPFLFGHDSGFSGGRLAARSFSISWRLSS